MKGLSQTLYLVVVAVVILIVALVLLTIFGGGMGGITNLTSNQNSCILKATTSCISTNRMPVDWNIETLTKYDDNGNPTDKKISCSSLSTLVRATCKNNKFELNN